MFVLKLNFTADASANQDLNHIWTMDKKKKTTSVRYLTSPLLTVLPKGDRLPPLFISS